MIFPFEYPFAREFHGISQCHHQFSGKISGHLDPQPAKRSTDSTGRRRCEDAKIMTLPVGWFRTAPMEKVHYLPVSNMASWEIPKLSGGLLEGNNIYTSSGFQLLYLIPRQHFTTKNIRTKTIKNHD